MARSDLTKAAADFRAHVKGASWAGTNVQKKFATLRQVIEFLSKIERAFDEPDDQDDFTNFKVRFINGTWYVEYDVMEERAANYPT